MPYLRDRSRSPIQWDGNYNMDQSFNKLFLANVPRHWNVQNIIKFIKDVTKSIMISQDISQVNIFDDKFGRSKGTCIIKFDTSNSCKTAFQYLQGIVCEGKNLYVSFTPDPKFEYHSARHSKAEPVMDHSNTLLSNTKLFVAKFPIQWAPDQIAKFIEYATNSVVLVNAIDRVELIRDELGNSTGQCVLHFNHPSPCEIALNTLKVAICQGSRLTAKYHTLSKGTKDPPRRPPEESPRPPKRPTETRGRNDRKLPGSSEDKVELYGLNKNFLKSLNIKPPLYSTVFVGNLHDDVDEAKLHEVMSFAGHVLRVKIKKKNAENARNIATVEFDHPMEAVQAISMFHNKALLGLPMVVLQHKNPQKIFLPDGLQSLGPGLGPNGEPLKGVRYAVQIEPKTQFLKKQLETLANELKELKSKINSTNAGSNSSEKNMPNMNTSMTPMVTPINAFQPAFGYTQMAINQAQPMMTGIMQPMMGNEMAMSMQSMPNQNLTPMPVQAVPSSNYTAVTPMMQATGSDQHVNNWNTDDVSPVMTKAGSEARQNPTRSRRSPDHKDQPSYEDHKKAKRVSDMLIFNNLPGNVTESMLRGKMQEVGELKMVELTGGGRALVRFAKESDAERCQHIFHHSKVDGQVIDVDYF